MQITGRCYCGQTKIAAKNPRVSLNCHCDDCRRSAGAPVTAFVEFDVADVEVTSSAEKSVSVNAGVTRTFCSNCGSPISGVYDCLLNMIYLLMGVLDQAEKLRPQSHAHFHSKLPWLHIEDDLEKLSEYRLD